jgi:uncharacterized protein with HEPN domain
MSNDERERRYVAFISDCIEHIRSYLPAAASEFMADPKCQDAVVWRLQSIADAARNHLSDELKARHPNIDWRAVYGFRNIAAHQYADINLDLVWELVTVHLGDLEAAVREEMG